MSEFKRKRIYYTKAQIKTGLVTEGEEWMFSDTTEYIGQYHTYTTNEVFSEPNFIKDKSRKLIPYVPPINVQSEENTFPGGVVLDVTKNFSYDEIKKVDFKKSKIPNDTIAVPTDKDIKRGYMERYFAHKINDRIIIELDKKGYSDVGKDGGLDKYLWEKFKIRWKISGPTNDLINTKTGITTESGVVDTNIRTISTLAEKYPDIVDYLSDVEEHRNFNEYSQTNE